MRLKYVMLLLTAIVAAPVVVAAQPLAERVPGDAVVYLAWQGYGSVGKEFEKSRLRAVVAEVNFRTMWDEYIPKMIAKIGEKDPKGAETMREFLKLAKPMWQHPTAMFLAGLGDEENANTPKLGLLCDAGDEADALMQTLQAMTKGESPKEAQLARDGNLVILTAGYHPAPFPFAAAQPVAGATPLARDGRFRAAMEQVVAEPVAAAYIDTERLITLLDKSIRNEHVNAQWERATKASGFESLRRFAWAGRFDNTGRWTSRQFFEAPAPRAGILGVFDAQPLDKQTLARIPATAGYAATFEFDVARLLTEVRNTIAAADKAGAQNFDKVMAAGSMAVGRNLQKDVFEPLGARWVMYSDANVAGNGPEGLVFVNRLDDPAKAQPALVTLTYSIANFANGALKRQGITVNVKKTTKEGVTVYAMELPQIAPSWAIKDGNLYVAMNADAVVKAATIGAAAGAGKTFADNEKFAALRKELLAVAGEKATVTGFEFADLPQTAPAMYQAYQEVLPRLNQMFASQGLPPMPDVLPPLEKLTPYLSPALKLNWSDATGWHAASISPFPGSAVLSNQQLSMSATGTTALGVAILLPSLNRARETANRVKCASNMRQIGQGMFLYANENKGKYPPDLGNLILTQDMTAEVFVCPSGTTTVPAEIRAGNVAGMAAWVNQNSPYVYLGNGLTSNAPPDTVLLYEKLEDHDQDGMNILFGDGHIEWQTIERAKQFIKPKGVD
ncbi:MAG: hypothetical protein ACREIT_04405 [Tepidisphaeraceae bacterium]